MEPAMVELPPRYVVFNLSGAGLRCFSPPPAGEPISVPFGTRALGLEALRRTRLSTAADLATTTSRPIQVGTVMVRGVHVQVETSDPDTVSDAGTPGVQVAEESVSEDEVDSLDAFFCQDGFARKIDALAELVGIKGAYEPAAVLGEVVKVLQSIGTRRQCLYERLRAI